MMAKLSLKNGRFGRFPHSLCRAWWRVRHTLAGLAGLVHVCLDHEFGIWGQANKSSSLSLSGSDSHIICIPINDEVVLRCLFSRCFYFFFFFCSCQVVCAHARKQSIKCEKSDRAHKTTEKRIKWRKNKPKAQPKHWQKTKNSEEKMSPTIKPMFHIHNTYKAPVIIDR